jgi:hypothetical protein
VDFFTDRNGVFVSRPVSSTGTRSPVARVVLSLLPVALLAGIMTSLPAGQGGRELQPLYIAAAILVFTNIIGLLVRRLSLSGRIVVDQMQGTVTFVPLGGRKTTLQAGELTSIDLSPLRKQDGTPMTNRGKGWTVLGLTSGPDRKRYRLMIVNGDPSPLRKLADELSVLTSVTVNEDEGAQ